MDGNGQNRTRQRHDEVLADIARFAGSSIELDVVLDRIVERTAALTAADRVSIWLLDATRWKLLPSALWGMHPAFTTNWKTRPLDLAAEPLSREAIETGQVVIVGDAMTDARTDKASVRFFGDRSILVAPLARRGTMLGTLFLNHVSRHYHFSQEDVETTLAIANQAAIAIDNARLYRDTRRLAEQLRRSFRYAGEALAAGVDLPHTLQMMVRLAVETVDADGGSIGLVDETGRGTYLVASAGAEAPPSVVPEEFPLVAPGRHLGVLSLWRESAPFGPEERELLVAFAGHARTAIEHARLYASLQDERARAREAERRQADFASMISHELRTPLALIKGYASTLLRPGIKLAPETSTRFLEGIEAAGDRLRRLVDNLLTATALDGGLFSAEPRPVEVGALLRRALDRVSLLAGTRSFCVSVEPEPLWILADEDQLSQVVENLVTNAIKYAPGASPVEITAMQKGDRVQARVRDWGTGIPADALELIFEKFYRVASNQQAAAESPDSDATGHSRRAGGMGLGLYICRRIVEAHGGRIWAENLAHGGAAFYVELPGTTGTTAGIGVPAS